MEHDDEPPKKARSPPVLKPAGFIKDPIHITRGMQTQDKEIALQGVNSWIQDDQSLQRSGKHAVNFVASMWGGRVTWLVRALWLFLICGLVGHDLLYLGGHVNNLLSNCRVRQVRVYFPHGSSVGWTDTADLLPGSVEGQLEMGLYTKLLVTGVFNRDLDLIWMLAVSCGTHFHALLPPRVCPAEF